MDRLADAGAARSNGHDAARLHPGQAGLPRRDLRGWPPQSHHPVEEYLGTLRAVARSAADGVMVYHWVDFLENELDGDGRMVEALQRFKGS
jgi:hypothetical protein